jgi:hypothetical protein
MLRMMMMMKKSKKRTIYVFETKRNGRWYPEPNVKFCLHLSEAERNLALLKAGYTAVYGKSYAGRWRIVALWYIYDRVHI